MRLSIFIIFCSFSGFAQTESTQVYDSLSLHAQLDAMKAEFGFGKTVPDRYALSFFTALSHYPELDSSSITFKAAKIKTTLNARPTVLSLIFRKRTERKYIIRVNAREKDSLILLQDVPFTAQIGLFGHELAHFMDYRSKSFGKVLGRLFAYSNKKEKARFEKEIDSLTVSFGLGWPLYAWSHYVLHASSGSAKYKAFKKETYLSPEEIIALIRAQEAVK